MNSMGELRSTTIGLLGPWGLGNLGCEATQEAIIQNIRSHIPKAQIIVFSVLSKYTKASLNWIQGACAQLFPVSDILNSKCHLRLHSAAT